MPNFMNSPALQVPPLFFSFLALLYGCDCSITLIGGKQIFIEYILYFLIINYIELHVV